MPASTLDSPRHIRLLREAQRLNLSDSFALRKGNLGLFERNQPKREAIFRALDTLRKETRNPFTSRDCQTLIQEVIESQRTLDQAISSKREQAQKELEQLNHGLRKVHSFQGSYKRRLPASRPLATA